jgi:purine-nucleoside phosphorylase
MHKSNQDKAIDIVREAAGADFDIALVLGSGLGALVDQITDPVRFSYADLPGFPVSGVSSHAGELIAGNLGGCRVLVLAGRAHYYEDGDATAMAAPIELAAALGCTTLILTNASGSLREDVAPGDVALISDHINFSGRNPLIGSEGNERFVDMSNAYDPALQTIAKQVAQSCDTKLTECIYMWFSGPSFETPAETRAARILGADLVGMSTVPEAILARHRGLRVAAFSVITNYGAHMSNDVLSHEQTMQQAKDGARKLTRILPEFLPAILAET